MVVHFLVPLFFLWASMDRAEAQIPINYQLDVMAGNIDLDDLGNGDQGQPTKRCKDIWTICGRWAHDVHYENRPCCRSEGPKRVISCRNPSTHLQEWAAGVENFHKTFCLPKVDVSTHWETGGSRSGSYGPSMSEGYSPSGDTAVIVNQEIIEQLTRIAEGLERKYRTS